MQSVATETFGVSFPSVYEHLLVLKTSIKGEHRDGNKCLSFISVSQEELNFYDYFQGEDLAARFRESCLEERGEVVVIADRTLPVAGLTAEIRTAQSSDGTFYYFGLVAVSDEYGYLFTGDCAGASRAFYEPLFEEIWQSLRYGNMRVSAAAVTKHVKALADNGEFWQIGDHRFVLAKERKCYISDGDGALYVKVEALIPESVDPDQNDIISRYDGGKVYLQFYFKGIYNAGIPEGTFRFDEEYDSSNRSYIWKGGFQYSHQFTGEAMLKEGKLYVNGSLGEYPVRLVAKLDIEKLVWEKYRFLSIEEASTASPEIVHQLWLTDPDISLLEEALQQLTNLRVLSVDLRGSEQAAAFKVVPAAVKQLNELVTLSLTGVSALDSLPSFLGDLKKLETLRVQDSMVEEIDPAILQLPVLKRLYLINNRLHTIHPALTESLETLVLTNNRLTTVPASVSRLQYLNIECNPLESLSAGLENIPQLSLELEKKITLLDYTYQAADGLGTAVYDDSRFYASYDAALLQLLDGAISAAGLDDFREGLIRRTRRSVALATTEKDSYEEKGNHRFGGLPDLPPGMSYPTFTDAYDQERGLQFIAQINCAAVAHLQDYLPRTGMLYFFIEDQEEVEPKVLYYDGSISDLQSARDLHVEADYIYDQHGIYTPFKAEAGKFASVPVMYNTVSLYPELSDMEDMEDKTELLYTALKGASVNPVHSMNTYVFKQHGTPEMEAADKKRGKPEEWMVLLKVGPDYNTGFQFWDAGEIYFVVHKGDLQRKDFSNVYCGVESN